MRSDLRYYLLPIAIICILFGAIAPLSVNAQNDDTEISGVSVPRIDGFVDETAPDGLLNEWEDGLHQEIGLVSVNGELLVDLHTKYIGDTIYASMEFDKIVNNVIFQFDTNDDGSLTSGDIRIVGDLQSNLNMYSSELQVFDSGEWMSLTEYNQDYGNFENTVMEGELRSSVSSFSLSMNEGLTTVELSVSLPAVQSIYDVSIAQTQESVSNLGIGISLVDQLGERYGYPNPPVEDANNDILLEDYHTYYLDPINVIDYMTDVGIDHIEVTQAVQTRDNDLSLASGKDTLARVFVDRPADLDLDVEVTLTATAINLSPFYVLTDETLSQTFTPPENFDRNVLSDSANFELPDSWVQSDFLILRAEVNPNGYIDADTTDNKVIDTFSFRNTHDLNIYYMEVNEASSSSPSLISDIRPNFVPESFDNFKAMFPSANPNFIELGWESLGPFSGTQRELKQELNSIALNIVSTHRFVEALGLSTDHLPPIPDIIFGFRTSGAGHSTPKWLGWSNSYAVWGGLGAAVDTMVMTHEINHNLGPDTWGRHTGASSTSDPQYGCGATGPNAAWPDSGDDSIDALYEDDTLGWDSRYGVLSWDMDDIMSYCQDRTDPKRWVSDYRWERWVERMVGFVPGQPQPSLALNFDDTSEVNLDQSENTVRYISGFMRENGSGYLNPSYTDDGIYSNPPEERDNLSPTHYLRITYPNELIEEYPLYGTFSNAVDHNTTSQTDIQSFETVISDNGTIQQVDLLDVNRNVLDTLQPSSYSLQLELGVPSELTRSSVFQLPLDGDIFNQSATIYTQLQYSHDDTLWHNIGPQTTGTIPEVQINKLPGGNNIYFRLRLTDGFETRYLDGNQTSTISDLDPHVKISYNSYSGSNDNSVRNSLAKGSLLSLSANALDAEDGIGDQNILSWGIFDENGNVIREMTGETIKFQPHETGSYSIHVNYTDNAGQTSSDTINVQVINPFYLSESRYQEILSASDSSFTSTTSENTISPTSESTLDILNLSEPYLWFVSFLIIHTLIRYDRRRSRLKVCSKGSQ